MKRILTLLMAVSLLLCLAACGKPTGSTPEQTPQQTESSDPPDQTEPPALEGEALSVLPAEDAGLAEGGYDAVSYTHLLLVAGEVQQRRTHAGQRTRDHQAQDHVPLFRHAAVFGGVARCV